MCLAVPMELKSVQGEVGVVELGGARTEVSLTLLDAPQVGDFVIVHAGFAIQKLDREQAEKDLALMAEILDKDGDGGGGR